MRIWTANGGTSFEAEYVRKLFDDVVLRAADGQERRMPVSELSEEDRRFITLANPPELAIDFMRSSKQVHIDTSPYLRALPPEVLIYQFGARVKQVGNAAYPYPLTVEVYAFSQQRYDPDKYHLISRQTSRPFILMEQKERKYEFMGGDQVKLVSYQIEVNWLSWREPRGEEFAETLVIVRDERGEIIAHNTTKNWLYENFDRLEKLPVGAWIDKTCTRVHPTSPKDMRSGIPFH
jgi:hypothetical protein